MKRLLISLCVAMALPALAQTQPAKPASSKKTPVPAKSKMAIMTRDQLRACFKQQANNSADNATIDKEKDAFQQERNGIVASKEVLLKQSVEIGNLANSIQAESARLMEVQKEFEKPVPKDQAKAAEVRRIEFNDQVAAHARKVEDYNLSKRPFNEAKEALDARIEANNARGKSLQERSEKYNDALLEWKTDCANKPYDVADEAVVKKELKAAAQ